MDRVEEKTGDRAEDRRPLCPGCGVGRVAPIMYGYPLFTDELDRALRDGLLVLGGCTPHPEKWKCLACGTRYLAMPGSRWEKTLRGVPVEIGILRDGEPARALVTVRTREPWTLAFQFPGEEPKIIAQGDDPFEAVRQLCRAADRLGVRLLVNGARRDARRHRVDHIFDPADASLIDAPDERDRLHPDR
ncbi:hypothetical protein [Streptosporangium fragile]